ncbi:MAG TPA: GGDEF domain-containing protein [Candidatus Acidoferrum sp.]|nr:GGDEF domain-containing protein [Candidatus Acidoferrum sp.]
MSFPDSPTSKMFEAKPRSTEYSVRLHKLQRREWWTWGVSVFAMLLLTVAVASLALPAILEEQRRYLHSGILPAVAGLVSLILLFGCYLTYEKFLINRLRMELAERQSDSTQWQNLALVDPLTGLYNRRFAERHLKSEVARAQRKGYTLTLVLFDLNDFKKINDRFGHPAGDRVLKVFADRLGEATRDIDVAARLGGDEFMLLLPECDEIHLPAVLRRLESIEVGFDGQRVAVGFSVGWSEYGPLKDPKAMFQEADEALYLDKLQGKAPVATHSG